MEECCRPEQRQVVQHKLSDPKRDGYSEIMSMFDQFNLEGTELEINQTGHMSWNGNSNFKMHPYLKAKSFSLVEGYDRALIGMFVGRGSVKVEFEIELEEDMLVLHHKHGFMLEMQRVSEKTSDEKRFSLYDALDDEDFTDLEIVAKNGKHISCHKCILTCTFAEQDWEDGTNFLSGMDEDIIIAVLHFSYCGCLPSWLSSKCAKELLKVLQKTNALSSTCNILSNIEVYLQCLDARDALQEITHDIESCLTNIMHLVTGLESVLAADVSFDSDEAIDKLIHSWKLILQESILEKKNILTMKIREEVCHELIKLFSAFGKEFQEKHNILGSKFNMPSSGSLIKISEALLPEFEKLLKAVPDLYKSWTKSVTSLLDDLIEANIQEKAKQKGPKFFWGICNAIVSDDMKNLYNLKEGIDCKIDEAFEILENARFSTRARKIEILSDLLKAAIKIVVFDVTTHIGFGTDERSIFKVALAANRMVFLLVCNLNRKKSSSTTAIHRSSMVYNSCRRRLLSVETANTGSI